LARFEIDQETFRQQLSEAADRILVEMCRLTHTPALPLPLDSGIVRLIMKEPAAQQPAHGAIYQA